MAAESLTYEVREEGIDDLRRNLQRLQRDFDAVEDAAADAGDQIDRLSDADTEELERDMRDAAEAIEETGEEAVDTAELIEAAFEDAGDAVSTYIGVGSREASDELQTVATNAVAAGQRIEGAAESAGDEFTQLTAQILAANGALESIDGTTIDASVTAASGAAGASDASASAEGGSVATLAVAANALMGIKNQIDTSSLTANKSVISGGSLSEVQDQLDGLEQSASSAAKSLSRAASRNQLRLGFGDDDTDVNLGSRSLSGRARDMGRSLKRKISRGLSSIGDVLPDEVGKVTSALGTMVGKIGGVTAALAGGGALTAAVTSAAAAIGGFATAIAAQFGDQGIKTDIKALRGQLKQTAKMLSSSFAPLIRGQIIPVLQDWNGWMQSTIPSFKAFTQRYLDDAMAIGSMFVELGDLIGNLVELLDNLGVISAVVTAFEGAAVILDKIMQGLNWVLEGINGWLDENADVGAAIETASPTGRPEVSEAGQGVNRAPAFSQKLRKILTKMQASIARSKQRADTGAATQEEALKSRLKARQKAFEKLQKLARKYPDLFNEELLKRQGRLIEELRKKVEGSGGASPTTPPEPEVPEPIDAGASSSPRMPSYPKPESPFESNDDGTNPLVELQRRLGIINRMPFLPQSEKAAKKTQAIVGYIRDAQEQGKLLSKEALVGFLEDLGLSEKMIDRIIQKLKGTEEAGISAGEAIKKSFRSAIRSASQELGSQFAGGLFEMLGLSGGNRGVKPETRSRLQLRRLKQEKRQLRQSLRNREIAYRTYALRVKSINQQIAGANKQLAEQTESAWRSAFESLGGFVKSVVKKMIAELASAAIMATMLAAITGGTSLSIGGMSGFGNFSGLFTKGLTGFAEGGVVTGPTPAMVGEYPGAASNPEIITPESKMRSIVEGALGGQTTEIVVRGETRTDGRDLVTTYNQTERLQRRKGRR